MNAVAVVEVVIQQHVEEVAHLRNMRAVQLFGANIKLLHLARLDERLAAHLDGLLVAGEHGSASSDAALENVSAGTLFAATVPAIETRSSQRLERLLALAEAAPQARAGVSSALGWVSQGALQGIGSWLLSSQSPFRRELGLAACSMHRADPGAALAQEMKSPFAPVRARACRLAGELGKREYISTLAAAARDEDPACRFWAAWSAVLLGDRMSALEVLTSFCRQPGPFRTRALLLALRAMEVSEAHSLLRLLAQVPSNTRTLVQGAGLVGDPYYVPWLIKQMENPALTRLAGESFSMITGLDLAFLDLDRPPSDDMLLGPTDNPEDENVDMDPDEGLPWPDVPKIQAWWHAHSSAYAAGTRTFMGGPVTVERCQEILRTGFQRQRIGAALYLCLLQPGQPLFEWRAPAWRQKRRLTAA